MWFNNECEKKIYILSNNQLPKIELLGKIGRGRRLGVGSKKIFHGSQSFMKAAGSVKYTLSMVFWYTALIYEEEKNSIYKK